MEEKNELPFDFYLPDYNMCIEYDGEPHFISSYWWGGDEGLEKIQIRDSIKTKYCQNNGVKLLRINYKENILEILKKEFPLF